MHQNWRESGKKKSDKPYPPPTHRYTERNPTASEGITILWAQCRRGDRGPSASSSSLLGIPAHVRNEPEQEPQALLHLAVSPELWEVSHSDLISAPKHWHGAICRYGVWEAMPSGSSIFRLQEAARNTVLRCPYPSHGSSVCPRRWTITGTSPNTDTGGGTLQPACIVSRRHRC